jgi:hypothetical protein
MTTTASNVWCRLVNVYTFTRNPDSTTDVDTLVAREVKNSRSGSGSVRTAGRSS